MNREQDTGIAALAGHSQAVKALVMDSVYNFSAIGYHLKQIREKELYRAAGWKGFGEYVKAEFGFSNSVTTRYMQMNDRFSIGGNSLELAPEYRAFSRSQLQEMLYLTDEQIGQAQPGMTVKEIRRLREPEEPAPEQIESVIASMMVPPEDGIPGQISIETFEDGRYLPEAYAVENYSDRSAVQEIAAPQILPVWEENETGDSHEKQETEKEAPDAGYREGISINDKVRVLEEEIRLRRDALGQMQDYWEENQPFTLLKYQMVCEACELLIDKIKNGEEGKSC